MMPLRFANSRRGGDLLKCPQVAIGFPILGALRLPEPALRVCSGAVPGRMIAMRQKSLQEAAAFAVLTGAVTMVYWPGFSADWVRDDFLALAFSRLLGSPFALFVTDHFHLPGAHFRPLGFAALWLNQACCGNGYHAFALFEWALHVAIALALYRLIRVGLPSRGLAILCTLLYAVHPAVIGPALWVSDRFGHMATLFMLIAVRAAYDYRDRPEARSLALVLSATLAALLSKELGLTAAAVIGALWLAAILRAGAPLRQGLAWLCAVVLIYFGWRWMVIGTVGSSMTGAIPLQRIMADGMTTWFSALPGYLSFWVRLGKLQMFAVAMTSSILIGVLVYRLRHHCRKVWCGRAGELMWTGVLILLLPGLMQAPIAALNSIPLDNRLSAVEAAMQSRLYSMSLAGIALITASALTVALANDHGRVWRRVTGATLAAGVLAMAIAAWQTADAYRARSVEIARVARSAVAALADHALPSSGCRVYFLGVRHAPEWGDSVSMDSIVKALSPDPDRVGHCLIHSESITYIHLLPAGIVSAEGTLPYRTLIRSTGPLLPRQVGDLEMVYLSRPERFVPDATRDSLFLAWQDGRFRDVTADVLAGRREFRFQ